MKKIVVNTINHSSNYELLIGENLLEIIDEVINISDYSNIAIITDSNLKTQLKIILENLQIKPLIIELSPGEINKNVENLQIIWKELVAASFDRKSLIINLGGGVISDIGGFAASTYMRGVDFINIPTTLLSQVDASVGGKTGIDFAGIKNLIGTFTQPKSVIIDVQTLKTLPDRQFISGFSEIIKHGLIKDADYFKFVTSKKPRDFSNEDLIEIISRSCEIKKAVVEKDPTEKNLRKILNFGHTIGHAIESLSLETPNPLLHGEAISIGMTAEAKISQILGLISGQEFDLIERSIRNAGLPVKTNIDLKNIFEKMKKDKKNDNSQIKWTLLKRIGEAVYDINVDKEIIKNAIEYIS